MFTKYFFAILISFLIPRGSFAESSTSIQELFETMKMEEMQTQTIHNIVRQQVTTTPELKSKEKRYQALLIKHVGWNAIKEKVAELWMANYSSEEVKALIDFYKTSVGQKLIEKGPIVTAGAVTMTQNIVRGKQFQEDVKKVLSKTTE